MAEVMQSGTIPQASGRQRRSIDKLLLGGYTAFTIVAVLGFGTFGQHPELLARFPELIGFYGHAFRLFAQLHVLIGALVLGVYLVRRMRAGWIVAFVLVYVASLASELSGTATGIPFGEYSYSGLLGAKWFGLVPILIPLSWFTMAFPSYLLARWRFPESGRRIHRLLLGASLLAAWDLALDPAMSWLTGYWTWAERGPYYGMPIVNLAGWIGVGLLLMVLIEWSVRAANLANQSRRWHTYYYIITLMMPLGMILVSGLWTAAVVTILVTGALLLLANRKIGSRPGAPDAMPARPDEAPSVEHPSDAMAFVHARAMEPGTGGVDAFFRQNSRSFSFAARWFPAEERRLIEELYAFCRTTDDLVDRHAVSVPTVEDKLDAWIQLVRRAYRDGDTGIPWLNSLMQESARRGVPLSLASDLVAGARMDVGPVHISNWAELDLYAYRVASVVGIWMCHLFGVRDEAAHARAAALGKAMQITNILRDVGEDLRADRLYLPDELLSEHGLDRSDLLRMQENRSVRAEYRAVVDDLARRADLLYEHAAEGYTVLPPRVARAIAVGAEVYRGIQDVIRENSYDNLNRRAVTSRSRKLLLAARGLRRLRKVRTSDSRGALRTRPTLGISEVRLGLALMIGSWVLLAGSAAVACPDLDDVRGQYLQAVDDRSIIGPARESLESCREPVLRAYDGALTTLLAKHDPWPHRKLRFVREGLGVLDAQVVNDPHDPEIRYLRLVSCYFLPRFFGRSWSVQEDFEALSSLLPSASETFPPNLFRDMVQFVLEEGEPPPARRDALQRALDSR